MIGTDDFAFGKVNERCIAGGMRFRATFCGDSFCGDSFFKDVKRDWDCSVVFILEKVVSVLADFRI